jgi:hypothetical protein
MSFDPISYSKEEKKPTKTHQNSETLMTFPQLQEETQISEYLLIGFLSYIGMLEEYQIYPDLQVMTLTDFQTKLGEYRKIIIK